jgi:hypothetical protein
MEELRADFPAESDTDVAPAQADAPARSVETPVAVAAPAVTAPIMAAPAAAPAPMAHAEPEVEETPLPHTPQVIASFAPPPATYKVVSEHDAAVEEPHRPVRKRRQESAQPAPAEPLQLVETASDKAATQPVFEDEVSRRPVRRRHHAAASAVPAEPLQLVETAPGAELPEATPPQT